MKTAFVNEANYSIKAVWWLRNCTFIQGLTMCLPCSIVFLNKAMLAKKSVIVQENSGGLWKLHEETQDVKNFEKIIKIGII